MQLANRRGIKCDKCGLECQTEFVYYSFDFYRVPVFDNHRPSLDLIFTNPIELALDLCPLCYNEFSQTIVATYAKIMSPKRYQRHGTTCELTGLALTGSYEFYYVVVAEVRVKMAGQTMQVHPITRILEASICKDKYASYATLKQQVDSTWTTQS